jgi:hypothetical protein
MNEKQLQAKIVMDFSHKMPEERGSLWSTRNTTFSERDGQTQKAMGMIAGVSDLILYFERRFVGLEVKVIGSSHSAKHVAQQLRWGEKIIDAGGEWYILTSVDEFWDVMNKRKPKYTAEVVRKMLEESGTKIKF